jgi:hypothetical protein
MLDYVKLQVLHSAPLCGYYILFFSGSTALVGSSSVRNLFDIVGKTPWTSDQLVARPLPKHRTT